MITCTHPGKLGDLAWSLPVVRQLARDSGSPVRLWLAPQCRPLVNLLEKQDYVDEIVIDEDWLVQDTAPATPRIPPCWTSTLEGTVHLGYPAWPTMPLPFYTDFVASQQLPMGSVDWSPWIHAEPLGPRLPSEDVILFHWTDRWFELKLGLTELITQAFPLRAWTVRTDPNSARWPAYKHAVGTTIENLARHIASVSLVVTDCSMAHVLTAAMGRRCVVVEPETDRHHPIFWPGSVQTPEGWWREADNVFGKRVIPVIGGDGKPTFDARHTRDTIEEVLRG